MWMKINNQVYERGREEKNFIGVFGNGKFRKKWFMELNN